jgi:RNA polymerase sigma-70 factor (ECF subfamily)
MEATLAHEPTTQGLLRQAREGSREAFDALVRRFEARLEALVGARLGAELRGTIEPADVKQEALLLAFQGLGGFEWREEESFLHWLGTLVELVILKAHERARYRRMQPLADDLAAAPDSPSRGLRREERFERLERALAALSTEHREVILLARVEKLPGAEIARRMGRSSDAVAKLLSRALKSLRQAFGNTESLSLPARELGRGREGGADAVR